MDAPSPARSRFRRPAIAVAVAVAVAALLVLLVAALPLGWLRRPAERALSAAIGRPVIIARLRRLDAVSFVPRLQLEGIRVAAPGWAGPEPTAAIAAVTVRLPILPLLAGGHVHPHALWVTGARLNLLRDAQGRTSWPGGGQSHGRGSPLAGLRTLEISDTRVRWADARRGMDLTAAVAADANGLRIAGTGSHRGHPLALEASGGALTGRAPGAAYPFHAHLASVLLDATLDGSMAGPLDVGHWRARAVTRASDARRLDDLIQVGLPGTQPLALAGLVTRDADSWRVDDARLTLGRSHMAARMSVTHKNGRTRLDAAVDATDFDFDDLSTDADHAVSHAEEQRIGKRLIPPSPIRLDHLTTLDGRLDFRARRLLVRGGSMFKTLAATVVLDHRQLEVMPVAAGLEHGMMTGRLHVDHQTGSPKLLVDLRVHDERIGDFFGGQDDLNGPIQARLLLQGEGDTVRAAMARANGRIGIVSMHGSIQRRLAVLASGDVVKSVGALVGHGGDRQVPTRCLVAGFRADAGILRAGPLVLDTPTSRLDGHGTVSLRDERIALLLHGRPKQGAALTIDPTLKVGGTLSDPTLVAGADGQGHGGGGLLGRIARVVGSLHVGGSGDAAPDADCSKLAAAVLR